MPVLSLQLETVSPLFLYGADQTQPELRAASVRGQLRYWLRAILGAQSADVNHVREKETEMFGSTASGSPVTIRVIAPIPDVRKYQMLPHREGGSENPSPALAIDTGQWFELALITRPGIELPLFFKKSLRVWLVLGGLGKRSRRTFGALWTTKWNESLLGKVRPQSIEDYTEYVRQVVQNAVGDPSKFQSIYGSGEIPPFPTLNPSHSQVLICREAFDSAKDANKALFGILRSNKYRPNEEVFGYSSKKERRASPLIAQVRRFRGDYYLILTAMRSTGGEKRVDWRILSSFMKDAKAEWSGETVWGGLS